MATTAKIGDVRVTAIVDVTPPAFPIANVFSDVPASDWDAHQDALSDGRFQTNFGVFLLQSPNSTVLVDTGAGPGPHDDMGGVEGKLMEQLRAAGATPEGVDAVVLTHLHADHIGWALKQNPGAESTPTFPNARYAISNTEWDYWTRPEVMAETPGVEEGIYPLEKLGLLHLTDDETAIVDGMRVLATPGHTPGHQSLFVESAGEKGLIAGDLLHNTAQFEEIDWCADFDMDKPTSRTTRKKWLEKAASDRLLMTFGHLIIDSNIGHVISVGDRYRWQPL